MLNLNTKEGIYTISIPIKKDYYLMFSLPKVSKSKESYVMAEITESQYHELLKNSDITLVHDNKSFIIKQEQVCCYGDIDFNNGSEDMEDLDAFNWLKSLPEKGISIPANYNYKTNTCTSKYKKLTWTETFKISKICQYAHGVLGKPKYVVIYKN